MEELLESEELESMIESRSRFTSKSSTAAAGAFGTVLY